MLSILTRRSDQIADIQPLVSMHRRILVCCISTEHTGDTHFFLWVLGEPQRYTDKAHQVQVSQC